MKMTEIKTCDIELIPDFSLANLENISLRLIPHTIVLKQSDTCFHYLSNISRHVGIGVATFITLMAIIGHQRGLDLDSSLVSLCTLSV